MELPDFVSQVRAATIVMPHKGFRLENEESWAIVDLGGQLGLQTTHNGQLTTGLETAQMVPTGTEFAVAVKKSSVEALRKGLLEFIAGLPPAMQRQLRANWLSRMLGGGGLGLVELAVTLESITLALAIAAVGETLGMLKIRRPSMADVVFRHSMGGSFLSAYRVYEHSA
jgi:hypothetical protein